MFEDITTLIQILNALDLDIDLAGTQGSEDPFILLAKLRDFLSLPIYGQSIYLNYHNNPQGLTSLADALLAKAVNLYNLKEHQRSLHLIIINIFSFKPINLALIKLLIANFQHLGYLSLAAEMYAKLFELRGEVDCLYFAGICCALEERQTLALANFDHFLSLADSSVQLKHNLQDLTKSCKNIIHHLRSQQADAMLTSVSAERKL